MASYLITGASRGIGLALSGALAARPASEVSIVYAAYRTHTEDLKKLVASSEGRIEAVPMDVVSEESIKNAVGIVEKALAGRGLDVLINNAGVLPLTPNGIHTMEDLNEVFQANVTSVHNVTRSFLPLMETGKLKRIINVSTSIGSISEAHRGLHVSAPAYKITKAALNMLTVQYAFEYGKKGYAFVAITPGWIKTDLGTDYADLPMETALQPILELVQRIKQEDNGKFLDVRVPGWEKTYPGGEVAW